MITSPISTEGASRAIRGIASEAALYMAAALSVVAAAIHLWVAPGHFGEWAGYGAFFLVAALAQGLYGLALLRWPTQRVFTLGIGGNLALVAFYVATRTAGIPFFGPHAWEVHPAGTIDLAAVAAELGLVAALIVRAELLPAAGRYLALGAAQSFGVGLALHSLHSGMHAEHGLNPVVHFAQNAVLSIPLSVLSLLAATALSRRLVRFFGLEGFSSRLLQALTGASAYALFSIPADSLAAQHAMMGSFTEQAVRDASVTLGAALLVLLALAQLRSHLHSQLRSVSFAGLWRPRAAAVLVGGLASLAVVAGPALMDSLSFQNAAVAAAPDCSRANYDRSYDVAATNVEVPYNRWGGTDPYGQLFVLQGDKLAVKNWSTPLAANPADDPANNRRLRPRPLVIRANAGECVKVDFTNELNDFGGDGLPNNPNASMKVYGPAYDASSDGSAVGYNPDTTVPNKDNPNTARQENSISYYWRAPSKEGTFTFRDQGALAGSEANSGSTSHGLYGAFVVEPAGSQWLDPETGDPLYAGVKDHDRITKHSGDSYIDASIVPAVGKAFRESVQISQDELPGGQGFGFNYGAEPGFNRIAVNPAGEGNAEQFAPDGVGEETSLSSWTFGDPALIKLASGPGPWLPKPDPNGPGRYSAEDCNPNNYPGFNSTSCYVSNVVHTYQGDPSKIRFAHAGVKETHVFHMHAHQWRAEPGDPGSTTIDSQTYGPGEAYTADLIGGSGSKPGTIGDSIFHCHLYPHFADGFWALFRTHDVIEDGTGKTPDGVNVRNLEPLPDRSTAATGLLPQPTEMNPGYPRFIPGEFGWRAPQPIGGISEPRTDDSSTPLVDESKIKDDPDTAVREDLQEATRVVAGRPLDATLDTTDPIEKELKEKLAVEKAVQERHYGKDANGDPIAPKPGAPLTDPCPSGAREITYNISLIQTDVVYNEAGWHDKQARILVPTKDVPEIMAGEKKPEPMFIRANAGDCISYNLTNRLPNFFGQDEFQKLVQTNMAGEHIHLVKFDVLGSDGSSNGWNYQQAAFTDDQAKFNKNLDTDPVVDGDPADGNVRNCDWNGCRVQDPPDTDGDDQPNWNPQKEAQDAAVAPGQTISERWYADYELRTVFTHDHHFAALDQNRGLFGALIVEPKNMDFRNPRTGEFYQPINNAVNGPVCGNSCNADAAGTSMDIIGSGPSDDFREFGLAVQDFVTLHKSDADGGAPINAPSEPESFPDDDPGTMAINYSNAPFSTRQGADPAHVYSSTVHGDPATPILQAYSEDPVRVRLIQGSQEEQHVFTMNGMSWKQEPGDPESPLVNSQPIGVSEAFNFQVPKISCGSGDQTCAGDYLYGGTSTDDMYLGAWGLLRARSERVPRLLPLPDNNPGAVDTTPEPGEAVTSVPATSSAPREATSSGNPCPTGAPTKRYNVVAMEANIEYNKDGDHDPYGLVYALASDEAAIKAGKNPEPLVLRANEGDCIQVRLTNKITRGWLRDHRKAGTDGDPTLPTEVGGTRQGLRVSLHPQLVKYDVRGSDGTAVGYNKDQTVAPTESILYRWYADEAGRGELGATNLTDFGDVRGHRHHGLFAGLNIEPKDATYHDPETGKQIESGASADIRVPGKGNDFREFTVLFQDGLNLHDASGAPIEDPEDHPPTPEEPFPAGLDAEDQGEKGFNYRTSPFSHRTPEGAPTDPNDPHTIPPQDGYRMAHVFDSRIHGDPDTPIFRSYVGDNVKMRVLQGSDKPRQHSFQVSGYSWRAQPNDPGSRVIGTQGGISVGRAFNIDLGAAHSIGDYRYGCGVGFHHLSGGLWGIMRVYPQPPAGSALNPTSIGNVDNPFSSGHPIMPLETSASASVNSDLTLRAGDTRISSGVAVSFSGKLTGDGKALSGKTVILERRPAGTKGFSKLTTRQTRNDGTFTFGKIEPRNTTDYRVRYVGDNKRNIKPSVSPVRQVTVRR